MGRDRHGSRGPAPDSHRERRSRSVIALARRPAGAFLLATLALLAFAPVAEAQAPSKVKDLTATAVSSSQIDLDWEEPDEFGQGFDFYQPRLRESGGSWQNAGTIGDKATTFFSVVALKPATQYTFQVLNCATNNQCESGDEVSATTHHTPPNTPADNSFAVFPAGDRKVQALWDALGNAEIGTGTFERYRLQYKESTASDWSGATDETVTDRLTSFTTVTLPSVSASYDFRLRAEAGGQHSGWTAVLTVAGKPGTPATLTVSDVTATGATLTWTAVTATGGRNLQNYEYRWREKMDGQDPGAGWVSVRYTGSDTLTAAATGLDPATTYEFGVRATNGHRAGFFKIAEATTAAQSASIGPIAPAPLKEGNLDGATLTVDLVGTTFDTTIAAAEFSITPAVTGLSVSSVNRDDNDTARLTLAYAWTDAAMTADTSIAVVVDDEAHAGSGDLTTANTVSVGHFTETVASVPKTAAVDEGDGASIVITLTEPAPGSFTMEWWTVPDIATGDVDYPRVLRPNTMEVVIPAGTTSATFMVPTTEDTLDENDETFIVTVGIRPDTLGNLAGKAFLNAQGSTTTITIEDDDDPPVLSASGGSVTEGDTARRFLPFTLTLNPASGRNVSVAYRIRAATGSNAATAGADFDAVTTDQTVTFSPGQTSKTVNATVRPDSVAEGDEVLDLVLVRASLDPDDEATFDPDLTGDADFYFVQGTIIDNEVAPTVINLSIDPDSFIEGAGDTRFTVTAAFPAGSDPLAREVSFTLTTVLSSTATSAQDYTAGAYTVRIAAGQTSHTGAVNIAALEDDVVEPDETIVLQPSAPVPGFTVNPATIILEDNDLGAEISAPASLTEASLDGARLTVDLVGAEYVQALNTGHFTLAPSVGGLTFSVSRTDNDTAVLTLRFTGDLTEDIDLAVTVLDAAHSANSDLTTAALKVVAERTVTLVVDPNPVDEGATATVTATMTPAPSADVTLRVSIAAPEGSANPFENGDLEQTGSTLTIAAGDTTSTGSVTLEAFQDDDGDDEEVAVRAPVTGGHAAPNDVTLTIADDDDPGVTATADDPIMIDEGASATYRLVLDTQPSADVRVTVSRASGSSDVTWDADDQADGDQSFVTFTSSNWNRARTVTVRAAEDADQVNDNAVLRHAASSSDSGYNRLTIVGGTVNVLVDDDDDVPGIQLGVLRPSPVPEGGTARYTLRLNTQPAEDVTVTGSSDNADVTFDADDRTDGDQATVTFTSTNWNASRTVTVRAATDPDAAPDEATLTHTASSTDADYQGVSDVLTVPVAEAETAAITLGALSVSPVEENDSATYTVVLDAQPTSSVVIDIASDNAAVRTQQTSLTFTTGNWDEAQTVTVNAVDDGDSLDETATLTHTVRSANSADEYDGLSSTLEVRVLDDDVPGLVLSVPALTVGEEATATYTVALQVQPSAEVVVAVAGDNPDVSVDKPRLGFTPTTWNAAQTVTVSAARDGDMDDDAAVLTHHIVDDRSAAEFRPVADETLAVTVDDNDTEVSRSITLLPAAVDEGDGTVDIQVAVDLGEVLRDRFYILLTAPARRGEDFTGGERVDGDLPEQAVFTLPLRLTLIDDEVREDEETVAVTFEVVNPGGDVIEFGLATNLSIVDNDGPGVRTSTAALTVPEDGLQEYTLRLNTQPSAEVTVEVASDNVEVTMSPPSLTFTPQNWNTPQIVTVSALSDGDGVEDRAVLTHTATSTDSRYNDIAIGGVAVRVPAGAKRPDADPDAGDTDDTGSTGSSGGGGGGGGGGAPANRAPEAAETLAAATVMVGASLEVDLSEAFEDADEDDLTYGAESSDESVATVSVDNATLTVRGVAPGSARITVTATDPDEESVSQTFRVTVIAAGTAPQTTDGLGAKVWVFASADDPMRQGFARVLNHSDEAGEATIIATDDAGRTYDPLTLTLGPGQTAPFNSDDLESGNAAKGLAGGTGPGTGGWRFEVDSATLDVEALGYLRTSEGFVTAMVATAPADADGTRRVATFNPASNVNQVSLLRLVNPHDEEAEATVTGVDDAGRSPGRPVALTVPVGTACTVDAAELETGRGLDCGSRQVGLGDGVGKWRLAVESDPPLVAMSLLSSPTGHLTNLSGVASADADGVWHAHLFPAASDPLGRQGFMRVRNLADEAGTVTIAARDDTDREYETLTLALAAGQTRHFNSDDLELGNASKGLTGSTGSGTGTWRLALSSDDVEFEANAYIRTSEGFLTAMNASAPAADRVHRIAVFNPGSNANQVSILRFVNPGTRTAVATVAGTDDSGARPGSIVRVVVPAGDAVELTAAELESGDAAAITAGALGDGKGKWRLRVEANRDIVVLSLLSSPTGHLTNLSRADPTRVD